MTKEEKDTLTRLIMRTVDDQIEKKINAFIEQANRHLQGLQDHSNMEKAKNDKHRERVDKDLAERNARYDAHAAQVEGYLLGFNQLLAQIKMQGK
jgi:uncharacterized protein YaiL (DUF2058 family)